MPVQTEQFKQLSKFIVCTDGGTGNTTLNGDHAVAATTLNVQAGGGSNFATGDVFRTGAGEDQTLYVVASSTANTVVIAAPGLKRAYLSLTPVREQVADQYGPILDAGFKFQFPRETTDFFIASQRLIYLKSKGYAAIRGEATFAALTMYTLALGLGAPRTAVLGALTAADPLQLTSDGGNFGTVQNVNIIVEGILNDDTTLRAEFYGCNFDYRGITLALARGVLSGVPIKLLAGGGAVLDTSASPFTGTTTFVATNADTLDGLTDFGFFEAATTGPLTTTTTSAPTVGGNSVDLTAVTNVVAGDWLKFGSGSTVEFHQVENVAALVVTTRTRFLRAVPIGSAVVRLKTTTLQSINETGVSIEFAGTMTEVRTGLQVRAVGLRPGNAAVTLKWNLTAYTLRSFAIASGQAIPVGTVLPFFDQMGNVNVDGLFCKGVMNGGKTFWANSWGNQIDPSGGEGTFTNAGTPPVIPCSGVPTSGVQFLVFP